VRPRQLTFARRRKIPSDTVTVQTYLIDLKKILKTLKISRKKLILLAILAGEDFFIWEKWGNLKVGWRL